MGTNLGRKREVAAIGLLGLWLALPLPHHAANYRVGDADNSGGAPDMADVALTLEGVLGLTGATQLSPLALANDDGRFDIADVMLAGQSVNGLRTNMGAATPLAHRPMLDFGTPASSVPRTVGIHVDTPYPLSRMEGLQFDMSLPVTNGEAMVVSPATVTDRYANTLFTPLASTPPDSVQLQWQLVIRDSQGIGTVQTVTSTTDVEILTQSSPTTYAVVDTPQANCFDDEMCLASCPSSGAVYYGQDAQYAGLIPSYSDQGDGTVLDLNTGLLWQQTPNYVRMVYDDAVTYCDSLVLGAAADWRLPSIKDLYTIADFNGALRMTAMESIPYLNTNFFDFQYDSELYAGQYWSDTLYLKGPVAEDNSLGSFGFNFADGHIKGYPTGHDFTTGDPKLSQGCFVRCVSGQPDVYGVPDFAAFNADIVTDNATGMMWQRADDGVTRDWIEALDYCEDMTLGGFSDWRLPSTKELHTIIDYNAPAVPALDTTWFSPTFNLAYGATGDYGWYWTSTTFGDRNSDAIYLAIGRAYSTTNNMDYYDWHGAGAQRSDPKTGAPTTSCSVNACDEQRIDNYVLCVRGGNVISDPTGPGLPCPDMGGGVPMCGMVPPGHPCCGDAFCGGPENNSNCPADCP